MSADLERERKSKREREREREREKERETLYLSDSLCLSRKATHTEGMPCKATDVTRRDLTRATPVPLIYIERE